MDPLAPTAPHPPVPIGEPPVAIRAPRRGCLARVAWPLTCGCGTLGALVAVVMLILTVFASGRTNVLLLGLDRRPNEGDISRTDTMMLVTVYPRENYVGALSIPRDLWVEIPGVGENRINTAHFFAENALAGSGPAAAVHTVEHNFGVAVHRHARIDFQGFVRIVDAMGGIEVDAPNALIDYEYPTEEYGITTVSFEPGRQHMDGERALAYARIRHGSSDFKRAERQQRVLQAIMRKLSQPTTWPRLPAVWVAVQSSVDTDVQVFDVLRLAPTLLAVAPEDWDRRVIEDEMVQPYRTEGGASVLLPVWEAIVPVLVEMFGE